MLIHFVFGRYQLDLVLARSDGALHTLCRGIALRDYSQGDGWGTLSEWRVSGCLKARA
jgi:hypothetical protein